MHLTLDARPQALDAMRTALEKDLGYHACSERGWIDDLLLAATEAATNIIRYGTRGETFEIFTHAESGDFELSFEYPGEPYTPEEAELPDPELLAEGGYGLFLIEALTDRVLHDTPTPGTQRIRLIKRLPREGAGEDDMVR